MRVPIALLEAVANELGSPVQQVEPVGGGCMAHATRLATEGDVFFLKYGRGAVAASFLREAEGLRALQRAGSPLLIPDVLGVEEETEARPGYLLLTWVESGKRDQGFWERFGRGLALLHRHTAEAYGFGTDNFIGRTPQLNTWHRDWPGFFQDCRLAPQVAMARSRGYWQASWDVPLDTLYRRLEDLLPLSPPASVLHGDLWSGNFLAASSGQAALIDPATYYGHRETDLAMTGLFGGFDASFYAAYREAWPLETGYETRKSIYVLYHLLNHLNLFGASYAGTVAATLKQFR